MTQNYSQVSDLQVLPSWQQQLQQVITSAGELCTILGLSPDQLRIKKADMQNFQFKVPRSFVARMRKGDENDPLLRQILPVDEEFAVIPGYQTDPLGESVANPVPGLLHKYQGRVLLLVTGACSVNCRYCFRRAFPYEENNPGMLGWQKAIDYIQADETITEVIFSGGDPLLANDKLLARLATQLQAISHVNTLRIHTRLPIMIPERVTELFIQWFTSQRLKPVLVLHANHAQEIDESVIQACLRLKAAGVTLLNQAVLLKGINDEVSVLRALHHRLFEAGVLPYYLHMLDPVSGAAHFSVSDEKAKNIMTNLRACSPGYLVPKLVREQAGCPAKTPVF